MNPTEIPTSHTTVPLDCQVSETAIAQMVGEVFEAAPLAERGRLLEQLMKPLGILSLVAVANGVFAKIRFRAGWPELHVQLEDVQNIQGSDVVTLVTHVQQVSMQAVTGLAGMLTTSPALTGSATAALLITVLAQRSRARRVAADEDEETFGAMA